MEVSVKRESTVWGDARAAKGVEAREEIHDRLQKILAAFRSLINSFGRGAFPVDWLKKQDFASGKRVITKFCQKNEKDTRRKYF